MISKELQIVAVPFSYQQIKVILLYRANINTPINYTMNCHSMIILLKLTNHSDYADQLFRYP